MGGVGVDLLLLLVLIFRASCIEDVDFPYVACKGVTGHTGTELTLDCTVNYSERCHAVLYKFKYKNTTICREKFTSKSNQKHFTCSYTPNENMTSTFLFFLQADCGTLKKYFTVNTAVLAGGSGRIQADPKETSVLTGKAVIAFVMAGISCFVLFVMGFVLIRKHNTKNSFGFLKNYVVLDDKIKKQCDGEITTLHNNYVSSEAPARVL